eukprot:7383945-Prymnesium_polylepis.3
MSIQVCAVWPCRRAAIPSCPSPHTQPRNCGGAERSGSGEVASQLGGGREIVKITVKSHICADFYTRCTAVKSYSLEFT